MNRKAVLLLCVVVFTAGIALPGYAADNPAPERYYSVTIGSPDPVPGSLATDMVNENVHVLLSGLPLTFIPNQGQYDPAVVYVVHGPQSTLFFTQGEIVITAREGVGDQSVEHVIRQTFPGSSASLVIEGANLLPGVANYFTGSDPSLWQNNVPTYGSVLYRNLYPGIDLRYTGSDGILKREFVVAPMADPAQLRLRYTGIDAMTVDEAGALMLTTGNSTLTESPVICYQEIDGRRIIIPAGYYHAGERDITFSIGSYDPAFPLVIDPALVYSTYLGGGWDDEGHGIAVDGGGNAYVTGHTYSYEDFPTTAGAYNRTQGHHSDVFVTKLNPAGSSLVYSTYLGGSGFDHGRGIAVDTSGNAYVTGFTDSSDFPTTAGAYNRTFGGGNDVFITKLNPAGSSLVYSTYLGGSVDYLGFEGDDEGNSIAVDSSGNAYVTGGTKSLDFPTTGSAYDRTYNGDYNTFDVFIAKLNSAGSSLEYSTYLGAKSSDTGNGIAVDASGSAYVTGDAGSYEFPTTAGAYDRTYSSDDAFVAKFNPAGSSLVYSTFLGGSTWDVGYGIAVDNSGNAYVTGETRSYDYPTTAGAYNQTFGGGYFDAFVTKINPTGSSLVYSTYLGGSGGDGDDFGYGIAVDTSGNAYVTGETYSSDFPTTSGAYNRTYSGGCDAFVIKLNPAGSSLVYSTYLGGLYRDAGYGIAVDSNGNAYVTGVAWSPDFPTTGSAFDRTRGGVIDAFVAKISTESSSTVGLYQQSTGTFLLKNSFTPGPADLTFQYGAGGSDWSPLVGNWDSDGDDTVGLYQTSIGVYFVKNSNGPGNADSAFPYGAGGDDWIHLSGDWDGDGHDTVGAYQKSIGMFFLKNTNGPGPADLTFQYGAGGNDWSPLVGDWDGDGDDTVGLYQTSIGVYFVKNTNGPGNADTVFAYGAGGDDWIHLSGDWEGDGHDTVGAYQKSIGVFFLKNTNAPGDADIMFQYGPGGNDLLPVVGRWV